MFTQNCDSKYTNIVAEEKNSPKGLMAWADKTKELDVLTTHSILN
jgi:hypothetical protein